MDLIDEVARFVAAFLAWRTTEHHEEDVSNVTYINVHCALALYVFLYCGKELPTTEAVAKSLPVQAIMAILGWESAEVNNTLFAYYSGRLVSLGLINHQKDSGLLTIGASFIEFVSFMISTPIEKHYSDMAREQLEGFRRRRPK